MVYGLHCEFLRLLFVFLFPFSLVSSLGWNDIMDTDRQASEMGQGINTTLETRDIGGISGCISNCFLCSLLCTVALL